MSDRSVANPANDGADDGLVDSASVHVDAPPEAVWDVVSDLPGLPRWNPECFRIRWVGKPTGPVVGARFLGFNRQGWKRWFTRNVVEEAERGEVFAWLTRDNKTRWRYTFEADGDGTRVTESRILPAKRPVFPKTLIVLFLGGIDGHNAHMRDNIRQTLDSLKAHVEG